MRRIGIGFGNAVVESIEGLYEINQSLKEEGVNPIDSIKVFILDEVDTTRSETSASRSLSK